MLSFVVVATRRGSSVPPPVLARLQDGTRTDLPFEVANHHVWSNRPRTVWFAGWADADGAPHAPAWHEAPDGLTAFTGHLWPRTHGWQGTGPWVTQLASHLERAPLGHGTEGLAGVFVAVSLAADGRSAIGADPLGIGLVYWARHGDLTVVSSRASLAAEVMAAAQGGQPTKDAVGSGWVAYSGFSMGDQTGFRDVTVIPPGAVVDIDRTGTTRLLHPPSQPWRARPVETAEAVAMLSAVEEEMTTAIRTALAVAGPTGPSAGLTGGLDSRLILALLLAEGRAGDVEFLTFGADDLPDVCVAREIAARYDLRHVVNPAAPDHGAWRRALEEAVRTGGEVDTSWREIAFRVSVQVSSAARNVGDGLAVGRSAGDHLLLSGLGGEAFRSNYPASIRHRSKKEVSTLPDGIKLGQAGILRPEAQEHYRFGVHQLLFDGSVADDSPQDVADAFYLRNRLRRWLGADQEIRWGHRWFPLYSISAVRLAAAIGGENRHARWIARHLMERWCAPLAAMGFAESGWPEGAAGDLVAPRRYDDAVPAGPKPPPRWQPPVTRAPVRSVARDERAALEPVDVEIMRRFLRHDPSNPVFEIVDPAAAAAALDRFSTLSPPERMQLYGATTAAMWLGDREIAIPHPIRA